MCQRPLIMKFSFISYVTLTTFVHFPYQTDFPHMQSRGICPFSAVGSLLVFGVIASVLMASELMTRLFFRQNFVYSMHSLCISYKTKSGTDGLWKGFHRLQTFSRTATSFQFRHITSQACSSYCDRRWWEKWYLWKIAQEANSFPFNILICLSLWTVKVGASFLGF